MTSASVRNSVVCVLIKSREGDEFVAAGSGFLIWKQGSNCAVMTSNHVVQKYEESKHIICVRFSEPRVELPAQIRDTNKVADLALLKVGGFQGECEPLKFGNSKEVPLHDAVHLLGYHLHPKKKESDPVIIPRYAGDSPGQACGTVPHQDGPLWNELIRATCSSKPGFSGGPLMWNDKVVGVHRGSFYATGCSVATGTVNATMNGWSGIPPESDNKKTTEELLEKFQF